GCDGRYPAAGQPEGEQHRRGDDERRDHRCGCTHCERGAADQMDSAKNDYEPLRAVDPGAVVEDRAVAPQPGHLGVAPLVGGEWSLPEGKPYEYGESDGEAAEKWGPARENLDRRTALIAAAGLVAALALAIWLFGLGLTPDRYLLVLLVPALILRRGRRYLLGFVPFAALLVI